MSQSIEKPAYNEEFRICDFSGVLDVADTITTASVVVTDSSGVDVSGTMISNTAFHTGNKSVRYKLLGGTVKKRYTLEVRISTASLQKFDEVFTLTIT